MWGKKWKICIFKHILETVSSICKHVAQPNKDPEATGLGQAGTHRPEGPCRTSLIHTKVPSAPGSWESIGVSLLICLYLQQPVDIFYWPHHKRAPQPDRLLVPPLLGWKWNTNCWEGGGAHWCPRGWCGALMLWISRGHRYRTQEKIGMWERSSFLCFSPEL